MFIDGLKLLILPVGTLLAGGVVGVIVGMLNWHYPGKNHLKHVGYAVYVSIITLTAAPNYLSPLVALLIGVVSIVGVAEAVERYADEVLPLGIQSG